MPDTKTIKRARNDLQQGKSPSTAAGEFVREEIEHVKQGKHGGSRQQAVAIGLAKARRAGVPLPPYPKGRAAERTRRSLERAYAEGTKGKKSAKTAKRRSRAGARVRKASRAESG